MVVKICGLSRPEHAVAAAAAGADMVGLVFAPSRRRVTIAEGRRIAEALGARRGHRPQIVGLFVNEDPDQITATAAAVGVDLVQLSGDEGADYAGHVALPIIKSVRLDGSPAEAAWVALARQGRARLLVDAHVPGAYGGTGARADWGRAAELAGSLPILLAGGLDPASVAAAIARVRPWGVDVSSGVETDGVKDVAKIEAFISAARP